MTTYLATHEMRWTQNGLHTLEEETWPYCSKFCRASHYRSQYERTYRDDEHYEFDANCANCGKFIPAYFDILREQGVITTKSRDGSNHARCTNCGAKWDVES